MDQSKKTPGQIAFEAYREAVGSVAYDGTPIPQWEEVSGTVRYGWHMAAVAVTKNYLEAKDGEGVQEQSN